MCRLARVGAEAHWTRGRVPPNAGHPIVLAEWRGAGSGAPTVLIYGHYDVQPPEPLELWTSPPFVGTIRDGRLYARGADDDKGQLWVHVTALEACLSSRGRLPINVIMLIEGEEEIGSTSLPAFLQAHRDRLACDYIVISDTMMFAPGVPNILASMRGIAYFEIGARSAPVDLHSGQYGGAVANAASGLARALVDAAGRPTAGWRLRASTTMSEIHRRLGARSSLGSDSTSGLCVLHRYRGVDGRGGLQSAGATLAPADVRGERVLRRVHRRRSQDRDPFDGSAKVSFRLVPDQTPDRVEQLLREPSGATRDSGCEPGPRRLHGRVHGAQRRAQPPLPAARRALATPSSTRPSWEEPAARSRSCRSLPGLRCRDSPGRVRASRGECPRAERMDRSR